MHLQSVLALAHIFLFILAHSALVSAHSLAENIAKSGGNEIAVIANELGKLDDKLLETPPERLSPEQRKAAERQSHLLSKAVQVLLGRINCRGNLEQRHGTHIGKVLTEYCAEYKAVLDRREKDPLDVLQQFVPALKAAYEEQFGEQFTPPETKIEPRESLMTKIKRMVICSYQVLFKVKAQKTHEELKKDQKETFRILIAKLARYLDEGRRGLVSAAEADHKEHRQQRFNAYKRDMAVGASTGTLVGLTIFFAGPLSLGPISLVLIGFAIGLFFEFSSVWVQQCL